MAETSSRSARGLGIASVLLGLVLLATGLFFAIGGGKLVALGGCWSLSAR
jgi:quinate dehydrogenase (quinone)